MNWLRYLLTSLALLVSVSICWLVVGALRDPASSFHGLLGSALWSTFGPHLVVLAAAALLPNLLPGLRIKGKLATLSLLLALSALVGAGSITTAIILATNHAGGSANPVKGLLISAMEESGPDDTVIFHPSAKQPLLAAIYRPVDTSKPAPVIVYIHGGGFKTGSYLETDADLRWFANKGWLVISVQYRLWTDSMPTWDKAPSDVACALAWVGLHAKEYGGDISRLAILGDSAGGNLAINTAYAAAADTIGPVCGGVVPVADAVVVQYPAVDPLAVYEHGYPVPGFEPKMLMGGYIGGDPYTLPDRVQAISSYHFLSSQAPPTLIIAPEKDALVPPWSVYRFTDYARLAGVDIELIRMPFSSHVFNQIASGSIGNQARLSITLRYLTEKGLAPERGR